MLCLFICAAYYVTLRIDMMWTKVSCVDCASMSWFTLFLMLLTSFVIAVPVSKLRESPKKGNRPLLTWLLWWLECPSSEGSHIQKVDGWYDNRFVGDIDVIDVCFNCSVGSNWVDTEGHWLRNCNNWCVLSICLLKVFHWHSRCPRQICAVMSHEWCMGYAFKIGWKCTDSLCSLVDEVLMRVIMHKMLWLRWVSIIYSAECISDGIN